MATVSASSFYMIVKAAFMLCSRLTQWSMSCRYQFRPMYRSIKEQVTSSFCQSVHHAPVSMSSNGLLPDDAPTPTGYLLDGEGYRRINRVNYQISPNCGEYFPIVRSIVSTNIHPSDGSPKSWQETSPAFSNPMNTELPRVISSLPSRAISLLGQIKVSLL